MDYKIISFVIMNVAFWGYVIPVTVRFGIPKSVSDSYYNLRGSAKALFTLSMWGFAFPAIILGVEQTGLAFLAGAGIVAVGASPAFVGYDGKHTMEGIVHRVGALTAIVASQLMILRADALALFSVWFILCAVALLPRFRRHAIFIIELLSYLAVAAFYLIRLI